MMPQLPKLPSNPVQSNPEASIESWPGARHWGGCREAHPSPYGALSPARKVGGHEKEARAEDLN